MFAGLRDPDQNKLKDIETNKIFYDKLTFIYLEMPKFQKPADQLETRFEKWLYAIKNLDRLDKVPDRLREQVFEKFFQVAEIANFTPDEVLKYEDSLKYYRDLKNSFDTAREDGWNEGHEEGWEKGRVEGRVEGREEGILVVARNLLDILDDRTIAVKTGLSEEEVAALRGAGPHEFSR